MSSLTAIAAAKSGGISKTSPGTHYTSDPFSQPVSHMLVNLQTLPSSLIYKRILSGTPNIYFAWTDTPAANGQTVQCFALSEAVDASAATYADASAAIAKSAAGSGTFPASAVGPTIAAVGTVSAANALSMLRNGFAIEVPDKLAVYGMSSQFFPQLSVEFDDAAIGLTVTPSSKYENLPRLAVNTVQWSAVPTSEDSYSPVRQTAALFEWRESASTLPADYHQITPTIHDDGTASVTIPKGTFPSGSIQWRIMASATSGAITTTDWHTSSTADVTATAVPLSPVGILVDSNTPVTFRWRHVIASGTEATGAILKISDDGTTWRNLATITDAADSYTAPAGTLGTGTKYWYVISRNSSLVYGTRSDIAQFVSIGAPDAPAVTVQSATPRPTISWSADGQQAYQVEIGSAVRSGTLFGKAKQFRSPVYLANGSYTVRVRVQNEYGLWSPWGTAALRVTNVPGGSISLTATGSEEVRLSWTKGSFDFYIVYRNDVPIAKVTSPGYTDALSLGTVRYQVRGCYSDSDNYSMSNTLYRSVGTGGKVLLYDVEEAAWLHFLYDPSAHRSTSLSLTQDIQYVQLSGRTYPVAERSEFRRRAVQISCACANAEERNALRALLGHLTCCKTPEGLMVVGYPASISERSDDFFSTFSFTLEQIDRKEEIDLDA